MNENLILVLAVSGLIHLATGCILWLLWRQNLDMVRCLDSFFHWSSGVNKTLHQISGTDTNDVIES